MAHPAPPTLDDVARIAGVSTATVSRCLNDSGKVTDRTREKVMQAVATLGYTPNFSARAMATKRTHTIGAVVPTIANDIFARGLQAFQDVLTKNGYTLLVSSTAYSPEREAEHIRTLVARGADGLLLIGYERDPSIYDFLEARQVPYLLAWVHEDGNPYPAIGFNNADAMETLARAVLDLGHRDIAIISGIRDGNDRAAARVAGIQRALAQAGLNPDQTPIHETPYGIATGAAAFRDLMRHPTPPTAVMCVNDVLAAGALKQAQEDGLDVPADVSITGFDDIELAQLVTPMLATVHVPHREMGALAAQDLIARITNRERISPKRLPSTLRLRASLGTPRQ